MGSGTWSTDVYDAAEHYRSSTGASAFAYSDTTTRGARSGWKAHPTLDPNNLTTRESRDSDEHPSSLAIAAMNEQGELCAPGAASLPPAAPAPPALTDFPDRPMPLPDERPPADATSLAPGTVLGTAHALFSPEVVDRYLSEVEDDHPIYRGDDAVAHPGWLVRFANEVLHRSVLMGPWIHTESETQHFGLVNYGDELSTRANVLDRFERKGHQFVVLDVLTVANGTRPIQRVRHTAIYQLRPPA